MSIKAANNVFPHDPDDNWKQKLDRGGYVGTAKDLDDKINAIKNPDGILIAGSISKLGNVISIGEMTFKCRIDNNVLTNIEDFSTTIINATENYKRIDILVFTKFSTIVKIQGDEELESAKEPDVPPGTIKLSFISVFGSEITDPSLPIVIPDISEKLDKGGYEGTAQDIVNSFPIPVDISGKLDKGGYVGTAQDLKNSIPDLNAVNLKFGGYPSSRNDGQISMNKVLTTDEFGYLKLVTMAVAPAPYLDELIPDSYLPDTTGNFILKGAFFTPTMTIEIVGQTVNYITFISDNEVHANVTTGSAEGTFDVILNNGLSATFINRMLIVLGTVFKPETDDWIDITEPVNFSQNQVLTENYGVSGSGIWSKEIDYTKNFRVSFKLRKTPLGMIPSTNKGNVTTIELLKVSDDSLVFGMKIIFQDSNYHKFITIDESVFFYYTSNPLEIYEFWDNPDMNSFEFRKIGTNVYAYFNGLPKGILPQTLTQNARIRITVAYSDVYDVKYIETT